MTAQVVIHNSDVMQYKRCRQQWDFTSPLRRNLEPALPTHALEFGTIWHSALATYYSLPDSDRVLLAYEAIDNGFDAWQEVVAEDGGLGPEDEDELSESRQLAHGMFDNYVTWAKEADDFTVIWVEQPYVIPLVGELSYGFKPDGLAEYKGKPWLLEHKSAAKLPGDRTDYLSTDDQVGRYLWGLREAEGLEIEGVIYTIARKSAPKPLREIKDGFSTDKRQLTTYAIARQQLEEAYPSRIPPRYNEYLSYLQDQGYDNFFFRQKVRRNATELENIGRSLKAEALEMTSDPYIHRTPSSFNCGGCAFLAPCVTLWEGGDPEMILKGNYRERTPRE